MSNKITIKRSAVPGKIPLSSDLDFGEFAINYADGNLFFKDSSNTVAILASTQFVSVTGNITAVGNITGSRFIGNGSQLTGITATAAPAGNAQAVQFNAGGSTGGSDAFTFDGANVTVTGNISGNYFLGNGSQLTGLPATYGNANVEAYLPTYTGALAALTGNVTTTANIAGNFFIGNGSQLTGIASSGSQLVNGIKVFRLDSDGTIELPVVASFFDKTQDYAVADVHELDRFDLTQYQTAKYIVQATNSGQVHSTELLLTHNTANTFMSQYATLISGGALIELNAFIDINDVVLSVTSFNTDTKVDFFRTALISGGAVPPLDLEGDLMLQSGTEDLQVGEGSEDLNAGAPTPPPLDLEGDLMTETGIQDLQVGEGSEDLNLP